MQATYDANIAIFANMLLYKFVTSPTRNNRLAVRTARVMSNGWRLRFLLQLLPDEGGCCHDDVCIMAVVDSFDVADEIYEPNVDAYETKQYTIELIDHIQTEDICQFIQKYIKSF